MGAARANDDDFERAAVLDGFTDRLQADENVPPHWWANSDAQAYMAGYDAAAPLAALARRMTLYRFETDEEEVEEVRLEDLQRAPDDRLDALGWDSYLLARHRGYEIGEARALARPTKVNNFKTRCTARDQMLGGARPRSR